MRFHHILIPILFPILLVACDRLDRPQRTGDGEPASLDITLDIPSISMTTKASYADGNVAESDADTWHDWERLVDGQALYRVTLFVVRKADHKMVAYRDFYFNGTMVNDHNETAGQENGFCSLSVSGADTTINMTPGVRFTKAVRATFNYQHPLHGNAGTSCEKLVTGSYTLYAVANYSQLSDAVTSDDGGKTYSGLADEGDFTSHVTGLISDFNDALGTGGIDFSTNTHATAILAYKLHTVKDNEGSPSYSSTGTPLYICERRPQPLTLTKDLELLSGDNRTSTKLLRTYSRIRFELANESRAAVLTLNSFSFQTPFSQEQTLLFLPGDGSQFESEKFTPVLNAPGYAIHSYPGNGTTVNQATASTPIQKRVIYDAYILESRNGDVNRYIYDIDVAYEGHAAGSTKLLSTTEIKSVTDFNSWYTTPRTDNNNKPVYLFLLYNWNKKAFLYDDNLADGVISAKLDNNSNTFKNEIIQTDKDLTTYAKYIWQFEKGPSGYYISNLATTNYIGPINPDTAEASVYTTTTSVPSYELEDRNGGLVFKGDTPTNLKYLMVSNTGGGHLTHRKIDDVCRFSLYPVSGEMQAVARRSIPIQVIDQENGVPVSLTEIHRNDFLKVTVSVSYNPDGGYLYFNVLPWTDKQNQEVVFD